MAPSTETFKTSIWIETLQVTKRVIKAQRLETII